MDKKNWSLVLDFENSGNLNTGLALYWISKSVLNVWLVSISELLILIIKEFIVNFIDIEKRQYIS